MPHTAHPDIPNWVQHRRWWWLLLGVWTCTVAVAWLLHARELREQGIQVATEGARHMFRMVMLTRDWNASHGGVYVPVTPRTQPNPHLQHPKRDLTTSDGTQLTLVNPAFMTRLIAEMAASDSGVVFRLTSLKPIRPENAADVWEQAALQAFERGQPEALSIEPGPRGDELRYMAPLRVREACLACHASQGYRVGDIRGGISVSQRYAPIAASARTAMQQAALTYSAVWLLVALAGWLLLTQLRNRWFDLTHQMHELENTRHELVQAEKMASLGRMVAGFAHEINTPIGVAVGAVSCNTDSLARLNALLSQDEVNEDDLRAELSNLQQGSDLAQANLRRAANLVQNFKRTSIDQTAEPPREFDCRELIDDVLFALHGTLKRLPIGVQVDCPAQLRVNGQPGAVGQLLNNLVTNAVQHAFDNGERPGQIHITARQVGDHIRLMFADDGKGVTAEQLAHLFEPFYTTRRAQGGSGLGLYVAYNIVTSQLGGSIQCHSQSGLGCTFDIRFPAKAKGGAGNAGVI